MMNLSTTLLITLGGRLENGITASNRLRNSGENIRSIASSSSPSRSFRSNPIAAFAISKAPAFVVMIITTLRKSTLFPVWSVSLP